MQRITRSHMVSVPESTIGNRHAPFNDADAGVQTWQTTQESSLPFSPLRP